ncbi:MAG: hypothetical protein LH660_17540 [Phormidesmis sp. CAN_BIN36]|nr:hypothetical protein [Phormidesmis sp. CAN_BIN36]
MKFAGHQNNKLSLAIATSARRIRLKIRPHPKGEGTKILAPFSPLREEGKFRL